MGPNKKEIGPGWIILIAFIFCAFLVYTFSKLLAYVIFILGAIVSVLIEINKAKKKKERLEEQAYLKI